MFLKSLLKSILCARPKSMSLMRGWGTLLFSSMMFSGWREKETKKESKFKLFKWQSDQHNSCAKRGMEKIKTKIQGARDRGGKNQKIQSERVRKTKDQEIQHNSWKSHAKLQKHSLESRGPSKLHRKAFLSGHSMGIILPPLGLLYSQSNLLKALLT